jgi:putative endonuclease
MNPAGARAEDLCAEVMRGYGLRILERNWHCRHGEIDLIAEVRLRNARSFGGAAESVTAAKRARLVAAARLYLMRTPGATCRFDVLLVAGEPPRVEWIRNAFGE